MYIGSNVETAEIARDADDVDFTVVMCTAQCIDISTPLPNRRY